MNKKINEKNLEKELLQIKALVNFYIKEEVPKKVFLKKSIDYFKKSYSSFEGMMSSNESKSDALKNSLNKILEEANIYYFNQK